MPQNFQNWQSLGISDAPQSPSSPSGIPGTEFQDWSNLTGPSDLLKQAFKVQKPSGANNSADPVAPPKDWGDAMNVAIAPFKQKFQNISNAAGQLGQGNTYNAYAALKGQTPAVPAAPAAPALAGQQPQATGESSGFNFER